MCIGRADAEAEAPILSAPDEKSWLTGKDSTLGKTEGKRERVEDEMVRFHHWINGHESEQTLGDNKRQESLVCCSSWGCK